MDAAAADPNSYLCARATDARIAADVVSCVRRYVDAPALVAVGGFAADDAYQISYFDFGAPGEQHWTRNCARLPNQPQWHSSVAYKQRSAMVVGGLAGRQFAMTRDCYLWSLRSPTEFQRISDLNAARNNAGIINTGDRVVVVGGQYGDACSLEVFDGTRWMLHELPDAPAASAHVSVLLSSPSVLNTGGVLRQTVTKSLYEPPVPVIIDLVTLQARRCQVEAESDREWTVGTQLDTGGVYVGASSAMGLCRPGVMDTVVKKRSFFRYDERADRCQTDLAIFTSDFCLPAAAKLDSDRLAITGATGGGWDSALFRHRPKSSSCQVYDARANAWTEEDRLALPLECHNMAVV